MRIVYSVGHSNHKFELFLALLQQHSINTLVDVRSKPFSRWSPHFSQKALAGLLEEAEIEYVFLGRELGGRPDDTRLYDAIGKANYARMATTAEFASGIEQLLAITAIRRVAMMCSEEDPNRCHRRHLITPALVERGVEVLHIQKDGHIESETELRAGSLL